MTDLRVAITGAAGNVGQALTKSLGDVAGIAPVALVRNQLQTVLLRHCDAEIRVGTVGDPSDAPRLLAGCRAVVHCAMAQGAPKPAREANDAMLRQLAANGPWETSIHLSSVSVYGACVDAATGSFERPVPSNRYGHDKLRLERVARRTLGKASRDAFIVRLGHVYGPGQNVTNQVAGHVADPRFALPFGGARPSNAISIARLARVVVGLLTAPPEAGTYNLADGPVLDWSAVYARHTDAWGFSPVPALSEERSRALRVASLGAPMGVRPAMTELLTLVGGALSPARLAQQPAVRGLVDALRARAPERAEELARRVYTPRSMAAQVAAIGADGHDVSPRLLGDLTPGRSVDPGGAYRIGPSEGDLDVALAGWYQQTHRFRWEPAEVGLDE